jgi:LmbE family N-acetylglucosaminyl deacetylase
MLAAGLSLPPVKDPAAPVVLAAAAHPDDIEFMMAGTLLLLKAAGATLHCWNLSSGDCGSTIASREEVIATRRVEARTSAELAGAVLHPPLFDDFRIFYDEASLRRVAAVVRSIRPSIILTHSPEDYMEDHQNTARLVATAAFSRASPNFPTDPPQPAYSSPVALYHAMPHGLRDALRRPVVPDIFVNITPVLARKQSLLACHRSQQAWLDATQGMSAYLDSMAAMAREVGVQSGRYEHAEGWRRHSHLGYAAADLDPITALLSCQTCAARL